MELATAIGCIGRICRASLILYSARGLHETSQKMGPERFSKMKVTELEKYIRASDKANALPGRSQLRAAIHVSGLSDGPTLIKLGNSHRLRSGTSFGNLVQGTAAARTS
jgi:hypothetical protein